MSNKERFLGILKSVNRLNIDKLISWLEGSTFFTDPASAKFHGNYEGGLCDHSLAVYEEYMVKEGDTLAAICKIKYGSLVRLEEICTINNIKNADYIAPGQKIYLP